MIGFGNGRGLERIAAHLTEQLTEARALHHQAAVQRDQARAAIVACRAALARLAQDSVGEDSSLARGVREAIITLKGEP